MLSLSALVDLAKPYSWAGWTIKKGQLLSRGRMFDTLI